MQTLGLSDSAPRSESSLKALLWPTIRNETDLDYITRQGFWVCFVVGTLTLLMGVLATGLAVGLFGWGFYLLAGFGVRERSRTAAASAFAANLLGTLVAQRYTGNAFGIVPFIVLALLLSNLRGIWLSSKWVRDTDIPPPLELNQTWGDKLSTQLPAILWPKTRYLFYVLASLLIVIEVVALFAPLPKVPAAI